MGGLVAYASLRADRLWYVVAGVGGFAAILLLLALTVRLPNLVAWAIASAGATYAVSLLLTGGTIDGFAPVYAVGLLLIAAGCGDPAPRRRARSPGPAAPGRR